MIDLDDVGLPVSSSTVTLEGDVGITRIAVSDLLDMGGGFGAIAATGIEYRFAYVVATDGSIRVIDVDRLRECDAQVDPRYIAEVRDINALSCFPVGDVATPPRRAGARGPGIRLPRNTVPLDLEIVNVDNNGEDPGNPPTPQGMVGTFAFVTASDGFAFVINIDDDNYPDFEDVDDPSLVWMNLALPHHVRDFVQGREELPNGCGFPTDDIFQFGPRQVEPFTQFVDPDEVAGTKSTLLPSLGLVECQILGDDVNGNQIVLDSAPVTELSFAAPIGIRERVFPDLLATGNEDWFFTWEGTVSLDGTSAAVDGRPVRLGVIVRDGDVAKVSEAGAPYCAAGMEPFDIVEIIGCDPARGDSQCAVGETCYVHPDSPVNVASGVCIAEDEASALAGPCRDVFATARRYSVLSATSGELVIGERRRMARTTPLEGCSDDAQCELLGDEEKAIRDDRHPINVGDEIEEEDPENPIVDVDYSWACVADPTRAPGPDRCLMTCEASADCEDGLVCSDGYCVSGVVPPAECVATVQRYLMRVGDAFAVVGSRTGFLHNRIADPLTDECIEDVNASPLSMGRIPRSPEACVGDGLTDLVPNPCTTTFTQFEEYIPYEFVDDTCRAQNQELRTRETSAIRFSNAAFTIHLTDVSTTGDANCIGDQSGVNPSYMPVFPGYRIQLSLTGGFLPMFASASQYAAVFPYRMVRGPNGLLWVLDQGDASSVTRGRVLTLNPNAALSGFEALPPIF
jgi:hypothetical protein